jgi:cyclopropane fatty-acyl-phospholipid synthase-like methyltransferase
VNFDAKAYWMRTVPDLTDRMPHAPITPAHTDQEAALREVLRSLEFDSVLEVGCGLARVTSILAEHTDDLTAIDIGSDQATVTQKRIPKAHVSQSSIQDFETDRTFDLVIATEVLMHIPPAEIETVCTKLRSLANRWIVNIDWTESLGNKRIAEWNWLHDYRSLFNVWGEVPTGQQTIFISRP